jgi:hypothetical protein
MPTNRTTKRKPPARGLAPRGIPRPRGTAQPPRRRPQLPLSSARPAAKGPSGLIGRAQAALPSRKPPAKQSPLQGALAALSSGKSTSRKPSKKGLVGGLLGAVAAAAVARRRRGDDHDDELSPMTPPSVPAEGPGERDAP